MQQKTIEQRLTSIQHLREGHLKVVIPYTPTEPAMMTNCPVCRKPAIYTDKAKFVCRKCNLLFH